MGKFNCVSVSPQMSPFTLLLIIIIITQKNQTQNDGKTEN